MKKNLPSLFNETVNEMGGDALVFKIIFYVQDVLVSII